MGKLERANLPLHFLSLPVVLLLFFQFLFDESILHYLLRMSSQFLRRRYTGHNMRALGIFKKSNVTRDVEDTVVD